MSPIETRHLIHVGFPKCGSTSLQAWFAARPEIAFAHEALAGYVSGVALARDAARREVPPVWCVTSSESLVFPRARDDFSDDAPADDPIAARRERVCGLLATLFTGATILIVTRGFRAVVASLYAEYVRMGGTRSLDEYVSRNDPSAAAAIKLDEYFDYDAVVRSYELHFGSENVIVLPFELMREDASGFIATLEDRLGLNRSGEAPTWLNSRLTDAELAWYPRFSRVVAKSARLGTRGEKVNARYRARIGRGDLRRAATILARLSRRTPSDPFTEIADDVLERFRGRAEALVGRPLYAPYHAQYLIDGPTAAAPDVCTESTPARKSVASAAGG